MSPLAVAGVWAGAGVVGATTLPPVRLRRLGVLVPLAGLAAVLLAAVAQTSASPASGPPWLLMLDRQGQGLLAAAAASLALALLFAPSLEGPEIRTVGLVGAAAVVALTSANPLVWGAALLGGVGVMAMRWIALVPGRVTLAAGRVAVSGAAALLAAAPFLPVVDLTAGPRPLVVGALLACGAASLLGIVPVGGWTVGSLNALRGVEVAAWPLLLAPVVLFITGRLPSVLPPLGVTTFQHILLALGLVSAAWAGLQAALAASTQRYARVFLFDIALVVAAMGSGHASVVPEGALILILAHLLLGPLMLNPEPPGTHLHRAAWLLLSGLPPSPGFWGRLLLLEALAQASVAALAVGVLASGLIFLAALAAVGWGGPATRDSPPGAGPRPVLHGVGWLLISAGVALGLAPTAAVTFVFGAQ